MIRYANNHILTFTQEWGNRVIPQLSTATYHDATADFMSAKKSMMVTKAIARGDKIYIVGFKGCKGMIKKWLYDEKGRMVRERGRGLVEVNDSVITMSVVDINVPFITSDEVLLVPSKKDRPYNLGPEIIETAMQSHGFDPASDIVFIFFVSDASIDFVFRRFIDELRFVMTPGHSKAKGILALQDPKWQKYHASDEVTKYTNAFFFAGVALIYTSHEVEKRDVFDY